MYGCHSVLLVCLLFVIVKCVRSQEDQHQQLLNKLVCIEHVVCGQCVSAAAHCRWCADPYFSGTAPRCNDYDSLVAAGCGQDMIQRPEAPVLIVEEDQPLQDMLADSVDTTPVVQIQPQRIRMSLKPRETRKIKFSYRPARNYPLDLYYLMDLTWSMKDDKETLVSLRDDLPNLLKNLTDNFRLGFGSFADKPLMPYTSMVPRNLQNPCASEEEACEPTYSFRHHLTLTSQVTDFIETVKNSAVTANLDNAEAQLDALMQVLACGDKIGWSPRSRKIVILLSDGLLHTAGDGLLGGVIKRNDEQCHLNKEGYYSQANIYDYPSIAQIYRLLEEYKVNVIFAVTENVKKHYDSLHKILEDFTYIAKLESDSSNILKLVKTGYENIISIVDFEDDSSLQQLKIKYFSDCGLEGGPMVETTRCSGVEFGRTLNYEAHLTLETCPEYKKSIQTIRISESQLGQDSLSLEVEIQCGCTCENGTQLQRQRDMSAACPANSKLVCGVCQCYSGWSGPTCSCSLGDEAASALLSAQCREPNSTRNIPCSGFGDCLCGECECDPGFSGKYCQCRACEVSLDNHVECGGADRGVCVCGVCACADGWGGATCDCPDSSDSCLAPGAGGEVCSGHGDCVCGRCQCTSSEGIKYSGAYCETCATCDNPLCAHAEPCVSCHLNRNCTAVDEQTSVCVTPTSNYTVTERLSNANAASTEDTWCVLRRDDDGLECEYQYTYKAATQTMVHMEVIIRAKECSQLTSARLMTSGLVIMACVIAAGIIVIIGVKIAQIISDRRAYAKFAAEAEWSIAMNERQQNPLYISPISEFRLPDSYPRDKNE